MFEHQPKQTIQKKISCQPAAALIKCAAAGIAVSMLMLTGFSWLYTRITIPFWAAVPLATGAVSAGCFCSGLTLAKSIQKNGLFLGLCCGLAFFAVYLCAVLLCGQFDFTATASLKLVSFLLSGCLGGFAGILISEKQKKPRRVIAG